MKFIYSLFVFLFTTSLFAQVDFKGTVFAGKNTIAKAKITFKTNDTYYTAATNDEGVFTLQLKEYCQGVITIDSDQYEHYTATILIDANTTTQDFDLIKTNQNTLQTVEVIGRSSRKYTSDYSFSATKIGIDNKLIPQSVTTITKELMQDRQAYLLADVVKIAPGVIPSSFYNQYAIRGISQNEEGQIINGMRTRQYYFLQPITSNIERVEVLKGPASATFSTVDPGGSINLVTKKPLQTERKEVSFSAGSFSILRGTIDFTGPLDKDKKLLYRFNGAYQQAKSYRDLVNNDSFLVSPSISYLFDDKTKINAELIYSNMNGNLDRGQPIFGAVAGQTSLDSTPIGLNLGAPNDFFKTKELIFMTNFSRQITSKFLFNLQYMKQTWNEDLQEHRTTNAFATDITGRSVQSLAAMQFVQRKQNWDTDNISAYLTYDFEWGAIKNKTLVGFDFSGWEKIKGGGQNAARGFLLNNGSVTNSFVVANAANYQTITYNGVVLPKPNVTYFDLANPTYTVRNINDYQMNVRTAIPSAYTKSEALYFQNFFQWNKVSVLLSLRSEWFKDYINYKTNNQKEYVNKVVLPRIGVTYQINKNINIYSTYLEGFQPQSNTVTLMPNTGNFFNAPESAAQFEPLRSDLSEVGFKSTFFNNNLAINGAYFYINQYNLLQNANDPVFPDKLETRGAERSKGFELDVAGNILENWQINVSYAYIDAVIKEDNNATLIGARKQNTPYNSANLWTRYNFKENFLNGVGIGFGAQHSGSKLPWFVRTFEIPAYTIFDAALYYKPKNSSVQLAINMNNLFNETYWIGAQNYLRLFPGAPRNILATINYKF
ncbi:MAG: TonB-dependent siderophore receptor [Limnohabitans sp.]|nr:TonB-dependent siderophore receptor [Limnohabitans sp.]